MKEIDQVMHQLAVWKQPCVLATIVRVEGSSYRKPGATMLIGEDGIAVGAVSGGCIEKEVIRRAQPVFKNGEPIVISYDGRYTLGCNGTLYILIEPFQPADKARLFTHYCDAFRARESWQIATRYEGDALGSNLIFNDTDVFSLHPRIPPVTDDKSTELSSQGVLIQKIDPSRQLIVIGAELDAIKLCSMASELGYVARMILHPNNPDVVTEANKYYAEVVAPGDFNQTLRLDDQTAVVLMTHSYSRDLLYLAALAKGDAVRFLGLVGPKQRASELMNDLLEQGTEPPEWFDDRIHAPAGLDIGGEVPAEIAVSILAEIQTIFSGHSGGTLSKKSSGIHEPHYQ
jgi:xanthine dehydrogenase accessory factor